MVFFRNRYPKGLAAHTLRGGPVPMHIKMEHMKLEGKSSWGDREGVVEQGMGKWG